MLDVTVYVKRILLSRGKGVGGSYTCGRKGYGDFYGWLEGKNRAFRGNA